MADDPIEDLFRQRLQHHEEMPPANGWQRIHSTLQQPEKKPFALWRWLSLALLPVATAVLVVKNLPENGLAPAPENATEAGTGNNAQNAASASEIAGANHANQATESAAQNPNSTSATTAGATSETTGSGN